MSLKKGINALGPAVVLLQFFAILIFCSACGSADPAANLNTTDSLTEEQLHLSANAIKGLRVANGLEVNLVAAEPAIKNPTNIDVDERGRIWVTEAYNYRPASNGNPSNPAGDRIMILEDKDGDGVAETQKVFYQGPELNSPLGICIVGKKVLISQSPYVWAFYDDNGDDSADRKEIMFQGIGGVQHDHGMHSFSIGPDGKLYFNFGNEGKTLKDKNGKVVLDQEGDEIGPEKYRQGMVFRCNPDGSAVECLGQNFRNPFELAVDSYGNMWQSDNDDDGNAGTRINYVMDYGNYGYVDEMTGEGWSANRTNIEDSIPFRHWHLNDPGVVPNLLQTGAGSPTGMIVYEGALMPEQFRNQIIHGEPGHNVVRSYPLKKKAAGYEAGIENILTGEKDQWFRPADICAAPDGSLIIADWYDPGVGGHGAGDQQKGRIYRIKPKDQSVNKPVFDFASPEGAIMALQNPNLAVRYHAFAALQAMGQPAVAALEKLWNSAADPHMRARAFWVLVKMPGGEKYIKEAEKDNNPDIRMVAIRAARQVKKSLAETIKALVQDNDPQVRRECAIALHHFKNPEAAALWAKLAAQYDGKDRWYLEALGIGADGQWDSFFDAYLQMVKDPLQTEAGKDIVWRSRGKNSLIFLSKLAMDATLELDQRLRYFRSFDFNKSPEKSVVLVQMITQNSSNDRELNALLLHHLDPAEIQKSAVAKRALKNILLSTYGGMTYIELTRKYQQKTEMKNLLQLSLDKAGDEPGVEALRLFIDFGGSKTVREIIQGTDPVKKAALMKSMGKVGYSETIELLQQVLLSAKNSDSLRQIAADYIGKSMGGEDRVVDLLKSKTIPEQYIPAVIESMNGGIRTIIYKTAKATYLSKKGTKPNETKDITLKQLLEIKAVAADGSKVFMSTCAVCHQVKNEGKDFGPKLSEIGDKLPKEGLFEAIRNPSAAISFGYEGTMLTLKDGNRLSGIISSKTESDIEMKFPGGSVQRILVSDVKATKKLHESMMPKFDEMMSKQELADLLEYLSTLKKN